MSFNAVTPTHEGFMNKFLPSGLFISQMLVACGGSPAPAGTAGDT